MTVRAWKLAGSLLCGQAVLFACAAARGPLPPSGPAPTGTADAADATHAGVDPLVAFARAHRAEVDRRLGLHTMQFFAHAQTPPRGFASWRGKRLPARVHSARMFAFGFGQQHCDTALAKDGTICDGAVYPGAPLTEEQTTRALEIARLALTPVSKDPNDAWRYRPVLRCFTPHHAVVFFDERGTPVAEITVCFECNNFRIAPGPAGEAGMTEREGAFFADTCRALDVGGCPPPGTHRMPDLPPPPEDDELRALPWWTRTERRRQELLARAHGVDDARRLADLSPIERKLLCGWLVGSYYGSGSVLACEDGRQMTLQEYDECRAPAPRGCAATAGDFAACARARLGTLCGPDAPECARTDACKKGVVRSSPD